MSLLSRAKRLWELSGTYDEDLEITKKRIFTSESKKKRKQKLATILQQAPIDRDFPSEKQND